MRRAWLTTKNSRGFSSVEVLLATVLFGFVAIAVAGALIYGQQSNAISGERLRANALAEEGAEAVRSIRDSNFSSLTDGIYGIAQSGGQWVLSGSSDTTGIFTRQITIGTVDATRKSIVSNVSWPQGNTTAQASLTTRLTNWMAAITPATSWTNAIQDGSLDASGSQDGLKVATVGNYAYLVRNGGTPDFLVVDISNTAAPTLVGSLSLSGNPTNIAVSGNYAYVSSDNNTTELQIIDVTTPSAPSNVGNFNAAGNANGLGVYAVGTTVYLTRASSTDPEFIIINAVVPALPTQVGTFNTTGNMNEVFVSGSNAYIASSSDTAELTVLDITTPASPTLAGSLNLSGTSDGLTLHGFSSTILLGQDTQLHAINVSTPTSPSLISSVTSTGPGTVLDVSATNDNTYAFIGTNSATAEFQVIDISNTASMSVVQTVDTSGTLNGVAYNTSLDVVAGASSSDTEELIMFIKN